MSLNFVFQSGIILKKFYAIRIKHAEIAYWNILAVIPECPSANWAVHLLVHFFCLTSFTSTTFPFFQLKCFLNVHHCKTFLKASHDWDFSLFCFPLAPALSFLILNLPLGQDLPTFLSWMQSFTTHRSLGPLPPQGSTAQPGGTVVLLMDTVIHCLDESWQCSEKYDSTSALDQASHLKVFILVITSFPDSSRSHWSY